MIVIDGKAAAAQIRAELKLRTAAFEQKYHKKVGLAVLLVGNDPASEIYVRNKIRGCEEVGISSFARFLPSDTSQEEAEAAVRELAQDSRVHGVLIQLPLPRRLNADKLLAMIPDGKDVDGFSPLHMGLLAANHTGGTVACTPRGVMELLSRYHVETAGKRAVVIGRSAMVGRPLAALLLNADATVTVCHSRTQGLGEIAAQADILVSAVGKPKFITADMVKAGAVVIDVGINRDENGKLCGDVDFGSVSQKASMITPVPGGVGPMTVAMLLQNVVEAAERSEA